MDAQVGNTSPKRPAVASMIDFRKEFRKFNLDEDESEITAERCVSFFKRVSNDEQFWNTEDRHLLNNLVLCRMYGRKLGDFYEKQVQEKQRLEREFDEQAVNDLRTRALEDTIQKLIEKQRFLTLDNDMLRKKLNLKKLVVTRGVDKNQQMFKKTRGLMCKNEDLQSEIQGLKTKIEGEKVVVKRVIKKSSRLKIENLKLMAKLAEKEAKDESDRKEKEEMDVKDRLYGVYELAWECLEQNEKVSKEWN